MKDNWYKLWRCIVADIMYICAPKNTKKAVDTDLDCYLAQVNKVKTGILTMNRMLLSGERSFRSIFYYRFRNHKALCNLCRIFLPDIKEIELYANIGAGVYLSSGYMVVGPNKTGKNLHICAGVIVGKNNGGCPSIGENVYIGANSTVIGNINIGDNVIIEAGSVVTKDIPENTVYGGNPARFIRKNTQSQEM